MSDSEDTPVKGPPPNETTDDTEAQETDPQPPKNRSRSQSRRARRRKQQQSQTQAQKQKQKQKEMPPVQEARSEDEEEDAAQAAQAGAMQPFQHIGPDSTSMDGPVTYARAQRGEIPMRPGNPRQSLKTGNPTYPAPEEYGQGAVVQQPKDGGGESDLMKQDGLKLRLELNLDLEIVSPLSHHLSSLRFVCLERGKSEMGR